METTFRHKHLVLDDEPFLALSGLSRRVHPAVKHPQPVIRADAPWDTRNDLFNMINVLYDEDERLFKMWYRVMRYPEGNLGDAPIRLAYATSRDGLAWERPRLGLIEVDGSKENNFITPAMENWGCAIFKDPSDTPSRRYKMIFSVRGGEEGGWAKFYFPLSIAHSADGIHWTHPAYVNPVHRGVSDGTFSATYDPDLRRYVLYTRSVPNAPRKIARHESVDLIHWSDDGVVLEAPDAHDPPEMYNFYYMAPFRYEGFSMGLLAAQFTNPISEKYESYHKRPEYPDTKLGTVEIQLAFSRDGRKWNRPVDRTPLIVHGSPGEPDEGAVYPALDPIVINGETWIYYLGTRERHCWWDVHSRFARDKSVQNWACGMLAKVPEDRFVSLHAEGGGEGWALSKADALPTEITINANAASGRIECELVTPYGDVVKDFARGDCVPATADGKDLPVRWKHGRRPVDVKDDHWGGLCLRFHLREADLFSFTTHVPDPTGQRTRDAASERWTKEVQRRANPRT